MEPGSSARRTSVTPPTPTSEAESSRFSESRSSGDGNDGSLVKPQQAAAGPGRLSSFVGAVRARASIMLGQPDTKALGLPDAPAKQVRSYLALKQALDQSVVLDTPKRRAQLGQLKAVLNTGDFPVMQSQLQKEINEASESLPQSEKAVRRLIGDCLRQYTALLHARGDGKASHGEHVDPRVLQQSTFGHFVAARAMCMFDRVSFRQSHLDELSRKFEDTALAQLRAVPGLDLQGLDHAQNRNRVMGNLNRILLACVVEFDREYRADHVDEAQFRQAQLTAAVESLGALQVRLDDTPLKGDDTVRNAIKSLEGKDAGYREFISDYQAAMNARTYAEGMLQRLPFQRAFRERLAALLPDVRAEIADRFIGSDSRLRAADPDQAVKKSLADALMTGGLTSPDKLLENDEVLFERWNRRADEIGRIAGMSRDDEIAILRQFVDALKLSEVQERIDAEKRREQGGKEASESKAKG